MVKVLRSQCEATLCFGELFGTAVDSSSTNLQVYLDSSVVRNTSIAVIGPSLLAFAAFSFSILGATAVTPSFVPWYAHITDRECGCSPSAHGAAFRASLVPFVTLSALLVSPVVSPVASAFRVLLLRYPDSRVFLSVPAHACCGRGDS